MSNYRSTLYKHEKPAPSPNVLTKPHWEGARKDELLIQRCDDCGHLSMIFPRDRCPECMSSNFKWVKAKGTGKVVTYTVIYRSTPEWEADAPYIYAIVELDEGPQLETNIVGVNAEEWTKNVKKYIGTRVKAVFDHLTPELGVPRFIPA